jgi:hypothetical protein
MLLVAMLAAAAQLTVALAPLAEGRESRMASHVEAGGSQSHYAHDEAKCISRQARSMYGALPREVPAPLPALAATIRVGAVVEHVVADQRGRPTNPRAPPANQV